MNEQKTKNRPLTMVRRNAKRVLSLLLTLCMVLGLLPAMAIGAAASDITWTDWSQPAAMPDTPGSYRLTNNVTLSDNWVPPVGEVNLDLNGKSITGLYGPPISVRNATTLNIYDNSADSSGKILASGNCIFIKNAGAVVTQYGGLVQGSGDFNVIIDDNVAATYRLVGGTVETTYSDTTPLGAYVMNLILEGGEIKSVSGNGVIVDSMGSLKITGAGPTITATSGSSIKTYGVGNVSAEGYTGDKTYSVLYGGSDISAQTGKALVTNVTTEKSGKFTLSNAGYALSYSSAESALKIVSDTCTCAPGEGNLPYMFKDRTWEAPAFPDTISFGANSQMGAFGGTCQVPGHTAAKGTWTFSQNEADTLRATIDSAAGTIQFPSR